MGPAKRAGAARRRCRSSCRQPAAAAPTCRPHAGVAAGLKDEGDKQFITLPDPKTGGHAAMRGCKPAAYTSCQPTAAAAAPAAPMAAPQPSLPAQLPLCCCRPAAAGQPAAYLLAGGCLQEINWFKQQYSSWFIRERVVQSALGWRVGVKLRPCVWQSGMLNGGALRHMCFIAPACCMAFISFCSGTAFLSIADGGLYLATPMDPLLLALPLLERARAQQNVFQDLEQILRCVGARRDELHG